MTAGPGDGAAAAAEGRRRVTPADRDHVTDVLKVAFVQDRLSMDEFDVRIGQVLAARTQADLAPVTADLPPGLAGLRPPRRLPRRRMGSAARWGAAGAITPAILAAGYAVTSLRGGDGWMVMALVVAIGYFLFWLSAGTEMLWQWHSMAVPASRMCVRCAHTVASHRTSGSCSVRPGTLNRRRCDCAGYVPPGVKPEPADLDLLPCLP
jgi:DUF1707 SHOCT-like domain